MIRARLVRGEQSTVIELEINSGRANRGGRINRSNPVRARDILGICQTVLFAPEDLALVKGDPSNRRRFLDELLVSLVPRHAATRSDYDRVLKQRNALLKSARAGKFTAGHEATLDVWDQHMARAGAELLHARLELVERLRPPHLNSAYAQLTDGSKDAGAVYRSTIQGVLDDDGGRPSRERSLRRRLMTFGCCPLMNLQSATSSLRSLQEKGTRTRYLLGRSAPRRTGTRAGAGPPRQGLCVPW